MAEITVKNLNKNSCENFLGTLDTFFKSIIMNLQVLSHLGGEDLEKIISQRTGKHLIGFNADVERQSEQEIGDILRHTQPADLLKYGFIPEFVGRIPVVTTLEKLDETSLVKILKEPKNALLRQYQKLFEFDHVKLHFKDEALRAIAEEASKLDMGARGLRSVLENIMLDLMFDIPSQSTIRECIVSEDVIFHKADPILLYEKAS